jgi:branched-chain amino acid transport system ATP-binding protein
VFHLHLRATCATRSGAVRVITPRKNPSRPGHGTAGNFPARQIPRRPAKSLSYGDQRRLEIVRALAAQPKLLLLDEPAAGMNATEKVELTRSSVSSAKNFQISILLVEHDMQLVMASANASPCWITASRSPKGAPANPKVIAAYLGD